MQRPDSPLHNNNNSNSNRYSCIKRLLWAGRYGDPPRELTHSSIAHNSHCYFSFSHGEAEAQRLRTLLRVLKP